VTLVATVVRQDHKLTGAAGYFELVKPLLSHSRSVERHPARAGQM